MLSSGRGSEMTAPDFPVALVERWRIDACKASSEFRKMSINAQERVVREVASASGYAELVAALEEARREIHPWMMNAEVEAIRAQIDAALIARGE